MSIDENPSSPQSAINVTTKKKMNPQAKAFCFIKIRFVPYRLLLRWVTDKKKVLSLMIVVAAAAMVSCAGKQAKQAETVEVEATEVVETPACCEEPAACEKADSCATACETPAETPAPAEAAK